ncbi:MAG: 2-C-methyl-D-erythritol 2,4-cyclodiphosphate synthase [Phycisphaera sp.]|nr:MAG: 2-C-methyl-D-erythritol 2,4-cyclodiphosphate synthase [Phycisphaera sp.]
MTQTIPGRSSDDPPLRIGHGYDLHRLEPQAPHGSGKPLVVGGVKIPQDTDRPIGPVAHSDGDALLHALTDAILGAAALPDIGQLFPNDDPANENGDSARFLAEAVRLMRNASWRLANVDLTVLLQAPKLGPHKAAIRERIAEMLDLPPDRVNVKGKTGEHVGPVGQGKAIEAHAVVLLVREG